MLSEEKLSKIIGDIADNYEQEDLFTIESGHQLPNRDAVIHIIMGLRQIMFPGYFDKEHLERTIPEYFLGHNIIRIYDTLSEQIRFALIREAKSQANLTEIKERTEEICEQFFSSFAHIQQLLLKDVQAAFDGDPAAKTKEEIIFCYPGLFAIFVYRIAHELYTQDVPFLPRIMTEYAHSRTGIDINSGAKIGEYFFIDHGTGVVIGETTEIGNNVKLYQGVTLGALSTRSGQKLKGKKRHPTIKDNVTVYSGASILGGETEIGEGVIVAGGAFVTKSVPAHTKVIVKNPEIKIKDSDKKIELQTTENKEGIWEI